MSWSSKEHDVFLSFRGEDTRSNFTSHLYNALDRKSIRTYIDYQLNRGEDVWPALAGAIEDSHASIVVFSENYASSKWCLEELVKILECRKEQGQVVIPVFHQVDPSHIRKQIGSYERAFAKHERDLGVGGTNTQSHEQRVLRWKAALTQAANISGWDSAHRDESDLIENIVNDVLQKLHLRYPTELKGLVGTEKNCKNVELLLKKCRVIGIWGMGGIGKSTIAKVLFAKLFPQYENVCFVANAKEYSPDKLFFELLKEEIPTSKAVGSTFDMRRLSSKKVFIVLDDMDNLEPLEYLCREYGDLHRDSRLIITTRDRQLLVGRVDWIYKVKKWRSSESLKLFCLEAFKTTHPPKDYESLSESAVKYAGGVPLALKVLGSYFHSRTNEFWESALRKLNKFPNEKIQAVLELSYAELDELERNIFLDIAFFFKGEKRDHVIRILDACGFEATSGIEVLEDRALITTSNNNIIQMHDLLQKMGLEIVRQECGGDPGRRSRVKDNEAREMIEENKGTGAIQGIALDLSQVKDLPLRADTFAKMKTLRFLKLYSPLGQSSSNTYLKLPTILEPLSEKLRYFEWIGYPFESLPSPFCAKLLVEIRMPHSKVKLLWQELLELYNLEGIDLSECKQVEVLPDLSKAPRLKWMNLSGCESLLDLHPSILSSNTLVTLILDRCTNLKIVRAEKHLKSLEKISVNGCLSLEEFAVSSDLIENLDLSNTGIQTLDKSIGRLRNLKWLNLEGLRSGHLLKELSCLTSLKELKLSDSGLVIDKHQLHVLFGGLRSLQVLYLKDCCNLFELPNNINVLSKLQDLRLDGSNVKRLPESINNLQELETLSLENCKELLCLPELPPFIRYLCAINCASLVSVSNLKVFATKMLGKTKCITFKNSLKLNGTSLELIMESLHLTMMSAAFHNVLVRRLRVQVHSYNYTSIELCLPGSRVPRQIEYRTTEPSITIELPKYSNLLGFIYSVVLSPAGRMKKHGTKIKCNCHLPEGGIKATWLYSDVGGLNSDHVYVWYDPFHCDSILKYYEPKVCFEFCVANEEGEVDGSICIQECGIRLISVSEVQSVLEELDLDWDKKKDLEKGVELESGHRITSTSIERSDEKDSNGMRNQIQNQQWDSSELSSFGSDSIVESDSEIVVPDSSEGGDGRKNHYYDVDESIKSTDKETKTDSRRDYMQNTRESTDEVKYEGNKARSIKPNARLQETVESHSDKENKSEEKSMMDELVSVGDDNEREEYFSEVEESIGYTRKEIKNGAGRRERITMYTDVKSTGNKITPAEPDARFHVPIESQLKEYYESEDKSITQSNLVVMVELESFKDDNGGKDYSFDEEVSIESTRKKNNTTTGRVHKEKSTKFTKVVRSEGHKGTLVEQSKLAKEDNGNKDHCYIVEESIGSTNKKTMTSSRGGDKENTTKSTEIVKSKGGNEGKSGVGMHLPMVSANEENIPKDKSSEINSNWPDKIEEAKYLEENKNLEGGQVIDHSVTHDLSNIEEPNHEKENKATDLYKAEGEDGSAKDPFAELESILLGSQKSSAKPTTSTTTTTASIREALHDLQCLLENSLESILSDIELQNQLHMTLEFIKQSSEEKFSSNVVKLVESMTSSVHDLFKDFALTQKVVEDHTNCLQRREKLLQLVEDAKERQESLNKEMIQRKFETERLDKEAKKLDEKIGHFVEQKKIVELKKAKLKETLEKCEDEKKKMKHEAKNKVAESKEIMLAIEKSKSSYNAAKSKQHKLNDEWEGLRTAFADNCETLVGDERWWHKPELLILLFFVCNIFMCYYGSEVSLHLG